MKIRKKKGKKRFKIFISIKLPEDFMPLGFLTSWENIKFIRVGLLNGVYILFLAAWTQLCSSSRCKTVYIHEQLSFLTLDLFPLLVLFVCSYSTGINMTFKSLLLITLNVGTQPNFAARNGCKNETRLVSRVSNRKVYSLHCFLSQWWSLWIRRTRIFGTCLERFWILTFLNN